MSEQKVKPRFLNSNNTASYQQQQQHNKQDGIRAGYVQPLSQFRCHLWGSGSEPLLGRITAVLVHFFVRVVGGRGEDDASADLAKGCHAAWLGFGVGPMTGHMVLHLLLLIRHCSW